MVIKSVEAIVEQQVRRWEAERSVREANAVHWPIITIAREYGARGAALGSALAEETGFVLWDHDVVHAIATEAHVSEKLVASLDEHAAHALLDFFTSPLAGARYTQETYHRQLIKVVRTIAKHGSAVIVGRGAHFILSPKHCLRLRVVAPIEERVRGLASRNSITERKARAEAEHHDRDRGEFHRQHFLRDVSEPSAYDLVINTGAMDVPAAVHTVLGGYEAKFGRRPSA